MPQLMTSSEAAILPLLRHAGAVVAVRDGRPVSQPEFLADIAAVAARLPDGAYAVNLCTSRYRFTVAWAAAMVRGQVTLLPNSRDQGLLAALAADYRGLYAIVDDAGTGDLPVTQFPYPETSDAGGAAVVPAFPRDQVAAILFTSGSTGRPTPVLRRWGRLVGSSVAVGEALALHRHTGAPLVATVPHVHSYGLESAVVLPLQHGLLLTADTPMFPADIRTALADRDDAILVTTPVHLRACVADPGPKRTGFVLSATAPLPGELAAQAEAAFGAPVFEIYGCSEAGQLATRRTVDGPVWRCLAGFSLRQEASGCVVSAADEADVLLADDLDLIDAQSFVLGGRKADMVDVAGKRSSIAYLTHQLTTVPGVLDGVFVVPDPPEAGAPPQRLAALAVAPGMTAAALLGALRARIDPVFLPRPLRIVDALPRNALGKLPRAQLLALLDAAPAPAVLHFPADHPAGPGHFPGDPLIPGAALLDAVVAALFDPDWAGRVDSVKFSHPVRPGESIRLEHQAAGDAIRFQGHLVGTGVLAISGVVRAP